MGRQPNIRAALRSAVKPDCRRFQLALIEARVARGLSRRELANRCGLGRQAIYMYENGESTPSVRTLLVLALVLDVPAAELLSGAEPTDEMTVDPRQHSLFAEAE
jgi:transcriptional regulator with XRE-family HTH domain